MSISLAPSLLRLSIPPSDYSSVRLSVHLFVRNCIRGGQIRFVYKQLSFPLKSFPSFLHFHTPFLVPPFPFSTFFSQRRQQKKVPKKWEGEGPTRNGSQNPIRNSSYSLLSVHSIVFNFGHWYICISLRLKSWNNSSIILMALLKDFILNSTWNSVKYLSYYR